LIRKVAQARQGGYRKIEVWGTGNPRRELLYSEDLADGCIHLLSLPDSIYDGLLTGDFPPLINVGTGQDLTIRELDELVMKVLDFEGELVFDTSREDGTPRKLLDISKISSLGWRALTNLEDGIRKTYDSARTQLEFVT
jgi:GDP-L-fucose synthase